MAVLEERGSLVLADVAGYTGYVVASPLGHAEDVLADLIEIVASRLAPVVRLNKHEGDAVFGYVLDGEADGSQLLDALDDCYGAFTARVEAIGHSTSCGCNACAKLPELDLKFVVHHGRFIRRPRAGGEELTGADVIVAHRLLKNGVVERLGTRGYALVTAAAVDALALDAPALGLLAHRESYDHVGDVDGFVLDLAARREAARGRPSPVPEGRPDFELETLLPVPPAVAWEYLTAPARRALWRDGPIREESAGGRRGVGTRTFCVDGRHDVYEEILDWRPFSSFAERRSASGAAVALTTTLLPDGDGTRVHAQAHRLSGGRLRSRAARRRLRRELSDGYARLGVVLAAGG